MEKAASAVAPHPNAWPRKSSAPRTTRPGGEPPDSALVRALSPTESQRNGCPGHSVASYRPGPLSSIRLTPSPPIFSASAISTEARSRSHRKRAIPGTCRATTSAVSAAANPDGDRQRSAYPRGDDSRLDVAELGAAGGKRGMRSRDTAPQPVRGQQVPQRVALGDADRVRRAADGEEGEGEPQGAAERNAVMLSPKTTIATRIPTPGRVNGRRLAMIVAPATAPAAGAVKSQPSVRGPPPRISDAKIGMRVVLAPKKLARKSRDIVPSSTGDSRRNRKPSIAAARPLMTGAVALGGSAARTPISRRDRRSRHRPRTMERSPPRLPARPQSRDPPSRRTETRARPCSLRPESMPWAPTSGSMHAGSGRQPR